MLPVCLFNVVPSPLIIGPTALRVPLVLVPLVLLRKLFKLIVFPVTPRSGALLNEAKKPTVYLLIWSATKTILTFPPPNSLSRGSPPVVVKPLVATQQTVPRLLPTCVPQLLKSAAISLRASAVQCSNPVTCLRPFTLLFSFLPTILLNLVQNRVNPLRPLSLLSPVRSVNKAKTWCVPLLWTDPILCDLRNSLWSMPNGKLVELTIFPIKCRHTGSSRLVLLTTKMCPMHSPSLRRRLCAHKLIGVPPGTHNSRAHRMWFLI